MIFLGLKNPEEEIKLIKLWYNGYKFGDIEVMNQFSVKNYLFNKCSNPHLLPSSYWANTGSTQLFEDILVSLNDQAQINEFFEIMQLLLLEHPQILKISENVTYRNIVNTTHSLQDLWSMMFYSGYLTTSSCENGISTYKIPNLEIKIALSEFIFRLFKINDNQKNTLKNMILKNNFTDLKNRCQCIFSSLNDRSIYKMFRYEASYHVLFFALFLDDNKFYVTTEETTDGSGYYDLAVVPRKNYPNLTEGYCFL